MHHIYDLASMAHALTKPLDPALERLLKGHIQRLDPELTAYTEYLLIEPGDTEEDIIRCVGFSPLVEPIDSVRFGEIAFNPFWGRYIERTQIYAKRRQASSGDGKHLFLAQSCLRLGISHMLDRILRNARRGGMSK